MKQFFGYLEELRLFYRSTLRYSQKRLRKAWWWFEKNKNVVVVFLVAKRGLYQRPFLHTSLFVMIGVMIVVAPILKSSYQAEAADQLDNFMPPSAVLSSFDEQETLTEISEKPRDKVEIYKVQDGDTLASIAEKFGVSVDTIKWANDDLKADKLQIGEELAIPPVTGLVIKVKKGETIYSIAKKYQTEAQVILNYPFNEFADLDTFALTAGQTLVVPDGVMPKATPIYSPRSIAQVGTTQSTGQFVWPTQGRITQFPVSYHMAVDIANSSLPPVVAADSGTVSYVERGRYGYGQYILIDHEGGFQTLYAHLSEIYVDVGQAVGKGVVVGKVGSTGRSSGPHLHFEIRKNGHLLNPLEFLK